MKNMFKMMGVALLAGAMLFTACKKDKEDTNTNSGTTTTYSVTVSMAGQTWQTNDELLYMVDGNLLTIQGEQDTNGFQIICGKNAQNYSFGVEDYAVSLWSGNTAVPGTTNGYINITAIDLNSNNIIKTISAKLKCEMVQIESDMWLEITLDNAKMVEGEK
jgi:hypothetical protein